MHCIAQITTPFASAKSINKHDLSYEYKCLFKWMLLLRQKIMRNSTAVDIAHIFWYSVCMRMREILFDDKC